MPVFTAQQTKAALELSNVVMPSRSRSAGLSAGATAINSLLVAHRGPRGVTRGLSHLNGLPLWHCLLISVYSLEDIDCITISHHIQKPLKLICHTEFMAFVMGTKGGLLETGHKRQTQCMDFWIIQRQGNNSSYTNDYVIKQKEGPSPDSLQLFNEFVWPGSSRFF